MSVPAPDHIAARLLLRAVLPALPLYVERDESARSAIEGLRFAVRFVSASGPATTLAVRDCAVTVDEPGPGVALRLFFLSDRDVIRAFRRQGVPIVFPWGGLHHLARLPALSSLLADMAEVLNTPMTETPERGNPRTTREFGNVRTSDRRELRVALLLGALLPAAVTELGPHDEECRRLLVPFGDFAAQWSVPRVVDGWITRCGGGMAWGGGDPPVAPDVRIEFRDADVALAAVDGMIDSLAASVTGEISVRGMIPLADALARVMERVSAFLEPGRS